MSLMYSVVNLIFQTMDLRSGLQQDDNDWILQEISDGDCKAEVFDGNL